MLVLRGIGLRVAVDGGSRLLEAALLAAFLEERIVRLLVLVGAAVVAEAKLAYTGPESAARVSGSPGPARTGLDGHVVESEGVDGADGANQEAKENVEAVVAVVEPARGGDEDGEAEGNQSNSEQVHGRGGGLAAQRLDVGVEAGSAVGNLSLDTVVVLVAGAETGRLVRARCGGARGESRVGVLVVDEVEVGDDERNSDAKLGGEVERKIDEAGGRGSGVATGVAAEAVPELGLVGLCADEVGVEAAIGAVGSKAAHLVHVLVFNVGHAAGEHVGSRLSAHVLDARDEEECSADGNQQTEPGNVQLPELALPYKTSGCVGRDCGAGDKDESDDQDDNDGDTSAKCA